jgi:hypothetical protein
MVLAHDVALLATAGEWMVHGKDPWMSAHLSNTVQVLNRSEEGRQRRGGAHQRGRWHQSSTAVKVPLLWVGERLWALVKLRDLRRGREEG